MTYAFTLEEISPSPSSSWEWVYGLIFRPLGWDLGLRAGILVMTHEAGTLAGILAKRMEIGPLGWVVGLETGGVRRRRRRKKFSLCMNA